MDHETRFLGALHCKVQLAALIPCLRWIVTLNSPDPAGSRSDLRLTYYTRDLAVHATAVPNLRHTIVWLPIAALCDRIERVGCCLATQLEERLMPDQSVRNPAIVLVEDEPDILIILHRLMRDLTGGYDIVTVNGGAEALAQIALRPVPLVITDYNMPGMNGPQLTTAINDTTPEARVVLLP